MNPVSKILGYILTAVLLVGGGFWWGVSRPVPGIATPALVCPRPQVVTAGTRVVTRTTTGKDGKPVTTKTESPVVVVQAGPQLAAPAASKQTQWMVGVAYPPRDSVQWLDGQLTLGARVAQSPLFINATVTRDSVMVGTTVEF